MCLLDAFCSGCDALSDGCCDGAPHPYWKGRPFVQVMHGFLSAMRSFFGKDMPFWSIWAVGTGRLICRSHVSWVQSKVCLLIKCMFRPKVYVWHLCLKHLKNMFDICAVCIWCMVILSIISLYKAEHLVFLGACVCHAMSTPCGDHWALPKYWSQCTWLQTCNWMALLHTAGRVWGVRCGRVGSSCFCESSCCLFSQRSQMQGVHVRAFEANPLCCTSGWQ